MTALTRKNAEALHALHDLTERNGYPPTQRELSELVGVGSSAIDARLKKLAELGLITRGGKPRSLALTDAGRAALSERGEPTERPVLRIDLETGERVRFASIGEAARESYCSRYAVQAHANGVFKSDFCDRWRFNWITEETA